MFIFKWQQIEKVIFSLMAQSLSPPTLLMAWPLVEEPFFVVSLWHLGKKSVEKIKRPYKEFLFKICEKRDNRSSHSMLMLF